MKLLEGVIQAQECEKILKILEEEKFAEGLAFNAEYKKLVKQNVELREDHSKEIRSILHSIRNAIWSDVRFRQYVLPLKAAALRFNCYSDNQFYGKHADSALIGSPSIRSDVSVSLFLSKPESYEGGELVTHGYDEVRVKGEQGSMVIYPSNCVHEVTPVTEGKRICAITWIQSSVREEEKRNFMAEAYEFGVDLKEEEGMSDRYIKYTSMYSNLLRFWADT